MNTFFKPNGFCENLLTRIFCIKNDKYPKKAHVVGGGGISPINSAQSLVKKSAARLSRQAFRRNASPKTGGRKNVVLFEVYYCALPFDNVTSLVRLVAEDG